MLTVYHYPACGTCKKAIAWLKSNNVEHKLVNIVESPPSMKLLAEILVGSGERVQKLFNTSGQLYREGNYKERLSSMSEREALAELSSHGKLIKRPLVVGVGVHLIGFNERLYLAKLG